MNTITLYRIKQGRRIRDIASYRVSQAYRMVTEKPIMIPRNYSLCGVHVHEDHVEWFESTVIPIVDNHNGSNMIDTWAVPHEYDPYHVTVAMCVNDVLIAPDILNNTTNLTDSPQVHKDINDAVCAAIQEYERRPIQLPTIDGRWHMAEEIKYLSRMLTQLL